MESWKLERWKACTVAVLFQLGTFCRGKFPHHLKDASDKASTAREMKCCVAVAITYVARDAAVNEESHDGRLVGDYGKMERGLSELAVLEVEERGCAAGGSDNKVYNRVHVSADHRKVQFPVKIIILAATVTFGITLLC